MEEIMMELIEKNKKNSRLNMADKETYDRELTMNLSSNKYDEDIEIILCEGPLEITMKSLAKYLCYSDIEISDKFLKEFISSKRIRENKGGTSGMRMVCLLSSLLSEKKVDKVIVERVFEAMIWFAYKNGKDEINKKVVDLIRNNILPLIQQNKSILNLDFIEKDKIWIRARELFMISAIGDSNVNLEITQAIFYWLKSTDRNMGKYTEEYMTKALLQPVEMKKDEVKGKEEFQRKEENNIEKKVISGLENKKKGAIIKEPVEKEKSDTEEFIKLLTAVVLSEDKVISNLKSDIDFIKKKIDELQGQLNKTMLNEQDQEKKIKALIGEKFGLQDENIKLTGVVVELKNHVDKLNKEIDDRKQFNDAVTRNREKQSEEYLNKLAAKLKVDYRDFYDAKELKMSIDLGENMRAQLETVFSILEKNGIKLK